MNIIYADYNIYHNSIDICTCLDAFPLRTAFKKFLLIKSCKLRPVVAVCCFIDRIQIFLLGVTGYIGNPTMDIVELAHLNK